MFFIIFVYQPQIKIETEGSTLKKAILYLHGKGGSATESEHFQRFFPEDDVVGLDYHATVPWDAKKEILNAYQALAQSHSAVCLIANSIGAFFAMHALENQPIEQAFLISPVVNMEQLILDMMGWAGITEAQLQQEQEMETNFGERLSWEYLCYVREHPITWEIPTHILYASNDNLTSYETISKFSGREQISLTVMENGEHCFHTEEQIAFLDQWLQACLS